MRRNHLPPNGLPPNAMLARRAVGLLARAARLDGARCLAAAGADPNVVLREVENLPLPEKLRARAASMRGAAADAASADTDLDAAAQLAPYQALPVTGKITRHMIRGLPVIEPTNDVAGRDEKVCGLLRAPPSSLCLLSIFRPQSRIEAIDSIIRDYGDYLKDRTEHHLGCATESCELSFGCVSVRTYSSSADAHCTPIMFLETVS